MSTEAGDSRDSIISVSSHSDRVHAGSDRDDASTSGSTCSQGDGGLSGDLNTGENGLGGMSTKSSDSRSSGGSTQSSDSLGGIGSAKTSDSIDLVISISGNGDSRHTGSNRDDASTSGSTGSQCDGGLSRHRGRS